MPSSKNAVKTLKPSRIGTISIYHPFVDGNKRTALNVTVVFYLLNGYQFEYD